MNHTGSGGCHSGIRSRYCDHTVASKYWIDNAHAWTQLVRAGYDVYRDGLNALIAVSFAIERVEEPTASAEVVQRCRDMQDTQMMPYFLHLRGRRQ